MHRVASHKNLKMILPGDHKVLWDKLDDIKKANPDKSHMYAEDPFQADRDFKAKRAEIQKRQSSEKGKKEAEMKSTMRSIKETIASEKAAATAAVTGSTTNDEKESDAAPPSKRPRFNKVLTMTKEGRAAVEKIIKKFHGFENTLAETSLDTTSDTYKILSKTLVKIGFSKHQVAEALETCFTLTNAIEWLLIHVPEDDLPEIFANNKYKAFSASIQSNDLKYEYAVRDIKALGYTEDLVRSHLDQVKGDKRLAIVTLTHNLCYANPQPLPETLDEESSIEMWKEEIASLEAIYPPEEFSFQTEESCSFQLTDLPGNAKISLHLWRGPEYPDKIPGITIDSSNTKMPKYALLDLIKQTGQYASENLSGEFMLMSLASWLKDNFETIRNNPCRLSQLAGAVTGVVEAPVTSNTKSRAPYKPKSYVRPKRDASKLLQEYNTRITSDAKLQEMVESRKSLPAWKKKQEIVDLIQAHQVTLVTGETGSGKSTQVAQFILDSLVAAGAGDAVDIVCSQPRRISAMGLAQRVADERASAIGDQVGYVIRGESKTSNNTMLRFVTTGILLRMIQTGNSSALAGFSHVIVDEVHERSLDSDFLLILLKRILSLNKNLKVILMSATVDPALFINYFGGAKKVGYTHIEGRTFPVDDFYLDHILDLTGYMPPSLIAKPSDRDLDDDAPAPEKAGPIDVGRKIVAMRNTISYDLVATLVKHIDRDLGEKDGAILIFMPGVAEIDRCINSIQGNSRFVTLPLHASLSPAEQRKVFPLAPRGKRKVVVSTNVAETSITIPDIVAVIDSGKVKETRYDTKLQCMQLVDCWVSKAAAKQRRGRAGRVRQGNCYKLFTQTMEAKDMSDRPLPEILRAPLEQLYLSVKSMGIKDTGKFLGEAIDPPETEAIENARSVLVGMGALEKPATVGPNAGTKETDLTPLGKHMSMIPADLRCAKLLVLSSIFGFVDVGLTIAAILSLRSPFVSTKDNRDELKQVMKRFGASHPFCGPGDLLVQAKAYDDWSKLRHKGVSAGELRRWCQDNFLSRRTLQDIQSARRQYISNLQEIGFLPPGNHTAPGALTQNKKLSPTGGMVRAVIGAAMFPNVANIVMPDKVFKSVGTGTIEQEVTDSREIRFFSPHERLFIHPSSTLFTCTKFTNGDRVPEENEGGEYLSYGRKLQTSKLWIDGLTPLGTYGLLFFADDVAVDPLGAGIVVDGWLGLKCWPRIGVLIKILRKLFNNVMEQKLANPALNLDDNEVVSMIQDLTEKHGFLK